MNIPQELLYDLAAIGATIEMAENRIILRAGPTAIPGTLVRRIREAKRDLMAALATRQDRFSPRTYEDPRRGENPPPQDKGPTSRPRTDEDLIIQWLNDHPVPSPPGRCAWCGSPESLGAMAVPFGTEPGRHTWLHPECWSPWHRARRAEASTALGLTSGVGPTPGVG